MHWYWGVSIGFAIGLWMSAKSQGLTKDYSFATSLAAIIVGGVFWPLMFLYILIKGSD